MYGIYGDDGDLVRGVLTDNQIRPVFGVFCLRRKVITVIKSSTEAVRARDLDGSFLRSSLTLLMAVDTSILSTVITLPMTIVTWVLKVEKNSRGPLLLLNECTSSTSKRVVVNTSNMEAEEAARGPPINAIEKTDGNPFISSKKASSKK